MKCPSCASEDCYIGFSKVECSNINCCHFKNPEFKKNLNDAFEMIEKHEITFPAIKAPFPKISLDGIFAPPSYQFSSTLQTIKIIDYKDNKRPIITTIHEAFKKIEIGLNLTVSYFECNKQTLDFVLENNLDTFDEDQIWTAKVITNENIPQNIAYISTYENIISIDLNGLNNTVPNLMELARNSHQISYSTIPTITFSDVQKRRFNIVEPDKNDDIFGPSILEKEFKNLLIHGRQTGKSFMNNRTFKDIQDDYIRLPFYCYESINKL